MNEGPADRLQADANSFQHLRLAVTLVKADVAIPESRVDSVITRHCLELTHCLCCPGYCPLRYPGRYPDHLAQLLVRQ
jgi:hypothetical protein